MVGLAEEVLAAAEAGEEKRARARRFLAGCGVISQHRVEILGGAHRIPDVELHHLPLT